MSHKVLCFLLPNNDCVLALMKSKLYESFFDLARCQNPGSISWNKVKLVEIDFLRGGARTRERLRQVATNPLANNKWWLSSQVFQGELTAMVTIDRILLEIFPVNSPRGFCSWKKYASALRSVRLIQRTAHAFRKNLLSVLWRFPNVGPTMFFVRHHRCKKPDFPWLKIFVSSWCVVFREL